MLLEGTRKILAAAVTVAVLLLAAAPVSAQIKKSDNVVKVKATADKPDGDGNQTISITLDIDKGWHLYANPIGNETLTAAQTTVKLTSTVEDVKLIYPPGTLVKDTDVGDYRSYEGKVTIKAQVKRAKGDTKPLNLTVKFQACNNKTCLLPATVKLTVD
jgi:uncharacterized protein